MIDIWVLPIMIKIYLARAMSNRIKEEVVLEAQADKQFLEQAGLTVLDPVSSEGVKAEKVPLQSSKKEMDVFWKRDKEMIREAHLVFDMTPHLNSEGCKHELGYARYHLQKPIVRIFPARHLPAEGSVAFYEDDAVVDSLLEAIEYTYRVHGTFWKRTKWRLERTNRCLLKSIVHQIQEWGK